jgi:Trk-type K+ transport system membrane component
MNKKIRWITETAVMLALLICLQWVGSQIPEPMTKQLMTGSCVNAVLAITVLVAGMSSGITVALISPVCAYLFGIAPNFVTVLPIMLGNVCFVVLLRLISGAHQKPVWRQPVALVTAAGVKFGVLYFLVVKVICDIASGALLGKKLGEVVVLAPPMLKMLPTMFAWPQLVTALIGGGIALLITPVLRKALRK